MTARSLVLVCCLLLGCGGAPEAHAPPSAEGSTSQEGFTSHEGPRLPAPRAGVATATRGKTAVPAQTQPPRPTPVWTVDNPDVKLALGPRRGEWSRDQGSWIGAPERGPLSLVMHEGGGATVGPMGFDAGTGDGWQAGCLPLEATCGPTLRRRDGAVDVAWTLDHDRLWYRALVHEASAPGLRLKVVSGPRAFPEGTGYVVQGPRGAVRVDGAAAWDADGKTIPAKLVAEAGAVSVEVDLRGAKMPVLVDPWLTPADATFDFAPYAYGVFFRAAGDPNGDGYEDLDIFNGTQLIYYGGQSGPATGWSDRAFSGFADGVSWRPFDFTGDGMGDFETSCGGTIGLWRGRMGEGITYDRPIPSPSGTSSWLHGCSLAGADVNGDGYDDLILPELSTAGYAGFSIFRGGPTYASWVPLQSPPYMVRSTSDYQHAEVGDVNADGFADVLLAIPTHPEAPVPAVAELYLGGPAGAALTASWSSEMAHGLAADRMWDGTVVEDVDGDGTDDIAISGAHHTAWWIPGGRTTVGEPVSLGDWAPMCQGGYGYCEEYWEVGLDGVGDLNADGHNDLVLQSGDGAAVILGGPYGPVLPPYTLLDLAEQGGLLYANRVGDLNADGFEELAIATPIHYPNQFLYLWYGETVDDIDQDGSPNSEDCEPYRHDTFPGGVEVAGNAWDEDCDGTMLCFAGIDADLDGATGSATVLLPYNRQGCIAAGALATAPDCDDAQVAIGPAMEEIADNDVDEDCDGEVACRADNDQDGYGGPDPTTFVAAGCGALTPGLWDTDGLDCDDTRSDIHPGALEIAGLEHDDDCDGIAACYRDLDGDGYGHPDGFVISPDAACGHAGMSVNGADCDEANPAVHPGAVEVVNLLDDDCNGMYTCYSDYDEDGFGDNVSNPFYRVPCGRPKMGPGDVASLLTSGDCFDRDDEVYPGAPEEGYLNDSNCDGFFTCTLDEDGDGYAAMFGPSVQAVSCPFPPGVVGAHDCDDHDPRFHLFAVEPTGSPIDYNCNGLYVCFVDADLDGFGSTDAANSFEACDDAPGLSTVGTDCRSNDPASHPGAAEVVGDNADQDCDNRLTCWQDADHDGFGVAVPVVRRVQTCASPNVGASGRADDCDDTTSATQPGALDRAADGLDANCDAYDGLELRVDASARPLQVTVRGAGAGARVTLAVSTAGPGQGPCPPALGGACVGVRAPRVVGQWTASPTGEVVATLHVPPGVPSGTNTAWQAWVAGVAPAEGSAVVALALP